MRRGAARGAGGSHVPTRDRRAARPYGQRRWRMRSKEGRVRRCELEQRALDDTAKWIEQVRRRWERRLDRMETYARAKERR